MQKREMRREERSEVSRVLFFFLLSSFFFTLLSFRYYLIKYNILSFLFFSLKKYKEKNSLGLVILCSVGSNGPPYQSEQWRKKKVKERKCV